MFEHRDGEIRRIDYRTKVDEDDTPVHMTRQEEKKLRWWAAFGVGAATICITLLSVLGLKDKKKE